MLLDEADTARWSAGFEVEDDGAAGRNVTATTGTLAAISPGVACIAVFLANCSVAKSLHRQCLLCCTESINQILSLWITFW
jgi:hypothetical protein